MARNSTRRFTPSYGERLEWLVLVGNDCAREYRMQMMVPDETFVRRRLDIPRSVPILIGRP